MKPHTGSFALRVSPLSKVVAPMSDLVLLIDDSELVLQMLQMVCQQAGYRVIACTEFSEVPERLRGETPDVIVTDLNMPDIPGGDPVAALRSIDEAREIPIVILSGRPQGELEEEARARGADAALSKDAGMAGLSEQLPPLLEELSSS
jgi:two-component system chemotaxis response regulator CheY